MDTINQPLIRIEKVSKDFGSITALKDVTIDINKGEFVFITGHSGAGKTTLLKLILREMTPDFGKIIIEGTDIVTLDDKLVPMLRQKIGCVFQDFKLINERTVRENVEVALAVLDVDEKEWQGRVDQVLKLVGLSGRSELFPKQLSGGELQRVSMARALVVNPKIILADEPTGNLDWETSEGILDLLITINKEGKTVIVATHNKMLVEKAGGRVVKISHGKVESDINSDKPLADKSKMKVKVEEV